MKLNTIFLERYKNITFPAIIIDRQDLYSAHDMEHLENVLMRCRTPDDRFLQIIDVTGYEFLFEPPVLMLVPNVLRQDFPWKKKEILELYNESPNKPVEIADAKNLLKKSIGDIIIHLVDLIKDNKPSLAGRMARPFRIRRRLDMTRLMN